jgi:cardiolipin synthase A/B
MLSWFDWSVVYYVSEWVIRLVMLVVVTRRRKPASSLSWLLVIFFLPWVGLLLYLLIGKYRLPRRRSRQHARLLRQLKALDREAMMQPNVVRPPLGPHALGVVEMSERLGHMPIVGGNSVDLIASTENVFERLVEDIANAEHHVHLLYYIYGDDETGRRVAEALIGAAERGVACRVLVDAVGSRSMLRSLGAEMARRGVEVRGALPVGLFRRRMARIDLRNHRKLAIIDGRVAYTGSHNLIDASYGRRDLVWHDLTVRLTGPVALELQTVFADDWHFEGGELLEGAEVYPSPRRTGEVSVQTLPSGPNYPTENYQRLVVSSIHAAQRHVIITTPYFVPDEAFLQAVQTAVLRGVQMELVVPRTIDHPLVGAASHAYFQELLESGVRIHQYHEGLLHAKTMSVDDEIALIGSSNFDIRSFTLDFEINLVFYGPEMARLLRREQQRYLRSAVPLRLESWSRRPAIRKLGQNIAKLLSPIL